MEINPKYTNNDEKVRVNDMSKLRIVAFGAHPGDPFSAGGTLAKHAKRGDEVTIVSLTYGERSHCHTVWEEYGDKECEEDVLKRAKEIKRKEMKEASEILGVKNIKIFDFGDDPLVVDKERLWEVIELVRELKPDIVIVHTDQVHIDHETNWDVVRSACKISASLGLKTKHPPHSTKCIYYFSPWYVGDWDFRPDILVDIGDTIELKAKALATFKSQKTTLKIAKEETLATAWWWGSMWYPTYVEPFKSFRPPIFQFLPGL